MADGLRTVTAVLIAVLLVAVIAVGGWQLGWWLKSASVNKNARIQQDSYGRQTALIEQVYNGIKEAETPAIPAGQRVAIVSQVCDSASKLTGTIQLTTNAAAFVAREC